MANLPLFGFTTLAVFINKPIVGKSTECSDYLISGFSGVSNDSITASSVYASEYNPWRIRLYNQFNTSSDYEGVWIPSDSDTQPYVQVRFNVPMMVIAVRIQGRIRFNKWVSTFYMNYSSDGIEWKLYDNSTDSEYTLLTGNTDATTIETIPLRHNITVLFVQIHPVSWQTQAAMRFDLIGCRVQLESNIKQVRYIGAPILDTFAEEWIQLSHMSKLSCSIACFSSEKCVSFAFNQSSYTCKWFSSNSFGNVGIGPQQISRQSSTTMYYFNKALADSNGYVTYLEDTFSFKIYTSRKTPEDADVACREELSRLLIIETTSHLLKVQESIRESTVLANEAGFIVSGSYSDGAWVFWNGVEIPDKLWSSTAGNDPVGYCIVVTLTGLSSIDCNTALFYAC